MPGAFLVVATMMVGQMASEVISEDAVGGLMLRWKGALGVCGQGESLKIQLS